jgi:topoisomerase-4 subunit B
MDRTPRTGNASSLSRYCKTIREFYNKSFEASDVRKSIVSAISIKVMEPVFESQTKTKLGSADMGSEAGMPSVRTINDFVKTKLDNYLHKNTATDALLRKILQAERSEKNCPAFEN